MAKKTVNREYKDRLFKFIFGNEKHKDLTLSLYNAINKTSYTSTDDIEITTIENAVYMGMHNDLSFIIADSMNLYEQQSTYNPNMPLRMLVYTGKLYSKFVEANNLDNKVYNHKVITIPYPKLIVFYNGDMIQPDKTILKLSDAFKNGAKGDIEVKVTMLNVNYGRNRRLMQNCRPLSDYSLFTSTVREYKKEGLSSEEAVDKALKVLPDDSEVKSLIQINKAEVAEMFLYEYDEEGVMESLKQEAWEDGKAEGIAQGIAQGKSEGIAQGKSEGIAQVAKTMKQAGYDLDAINKLTGITVEELKKL